jgi:hypothetical protein
MMPDCDRIPAPEYDDDEYSDDPIDDVEHDTGDD